MPFRSVEQRTYLKRNHPDIYRRWLKLDGPRPQPKRRKARRR